MYAGLESTTPQPASARGSVPVTRSTPQRAAAAESGQSAQTKAALKQVEYTHALKKKKSDCLHIRERLKEKFCACSD